MKFVSHTFAQADCGFHPGLGEKIRQEPTAHTPSHTISPVKRCWAKIQASVKIDLFMMHRAVNRIGTWCARRGRFHRQKDFRRHVATANGVKSERGSGRINRICEL